MKDIKGFKWPDNDVDANPVVTGQMQDLSVVLPYVQGRKVCVQAGGNVGMWPKYLSTLFETVYTFEPDPENFNCLCHNVPEHNVIKFNTALGAVHEMVRVGSPDKAHDNNCGAYQVLGHGTIPVMRIDDLILPACDLLYLDVEGYEYFAVQGGLRTIEDFLPVIAYEDKDLPNNYGIEREQLATYLIKTLDYQVVERIHRDIVLVHGSQL
jgi:FkbM family methyltransferase